MEQRKTEEKKLCKQYDAACKEVLSYKPILAFIMKHCITEFSKCKLVDIAEHYIEKVQVSEVGVFPDESVEFEESFHMREKLLHIQQNKTECRLSNSDYAGGNKISGLNIEDSTITEGKVYYDIRFFAMTPEKEPVKLIINIEAQTSEYTEYPLLMRAVYYVCRMISSQKEVEFTNSHYEQIKKVYSIWICTNPPKKKKGSINRYQLKEKREYGEVEEDKKHYDLIEVIMIRLSDDTTLASNNQLLTLLSTLFSRKLSSIEKVKELSEELLITNSQELERKMDEMCNLSVGVYNLGREEGRLESMKEIVFHMLSETMSDELILKLVQITRNQLEAWKAEFNLMGKKSPTSIGGVMN